MKIELAGNYSYGRMVRSSVPSVLMMLITAILFLFLARPVAILLGAEGELVDLCVTYSRILVLVLPLFMCQMAFHSFYLSWVQYLSYPYSLDLTGSGLLSMQPMSWL